MRILLYGSTALSQAVCETLLVNHFAVVGYVPSAAPTFPGTPPVPIADESIPHDLKLSIQYDKKIAHGGIGYNLHTGLLPRWAGCDILHHTLIEGAEKQGMTFHQLTDEYDVGPVVSWISYPVLPYDSVLSLYSRMLILAPGFVVGCLRLVEEYGHENIRAFPIFHEPVVYRRGAIDMDQKGRYAHDRVEIESFLSKRGTTK